MFKKNTLKSIVLFASIILFVSCQTNNENPRKVTSFNDGWQFFLGDTIDGFKVSFDDKDWRTLNLPHDWSIEGQFSADNPSKPEGGALPTGIGWYRKSFTVNNANPSDQFFIDFDGIYCNGEVWINEHYLGKRPFGYIGFRYELTPYLKNKGEENTIAVRVDNSAQPSSRWYTGSGIYRNVWLVKTAPIFVGHWGTNVVTSNITNENATVHYEVKVAKKQLEATEVKVLTTITNSENIIVAEDEKRIQLENEVTILSQQMTVSNPKLWSIDTPTMYTATTQIIKDNVLLDEYTIPFGIRSFEFKSDKGFFLNGEPVKIHGVNQHHDLGALGAAVNTRAMERQLEILKEMGCNAIRMAHNPPDTKLLDLCDEMGFLVIDESFDEWAKKKAKKGYHLYWDEWHVRDLQDMLLRDRNHPSIIAWSIGNEIREQFDSTGTTIAKELANLVLELDTTRYITCALTEQDPAKNYIYQSGALDLISFNYKHKEYLDFPKNYPGENLLASENMSALSTRGVYNFPSDSVRIWPSAHKAPLIGANDDFTVSAFDHVYAYWGATHEDTWNLVENNDFVSGMFIWSGFDYLGEPIPYPYPARSSYLGIIDLAGFPKDVYYLYQSEWTDKAMLHLFPHWNWDKGQEVDVWAYYNNADEVELFLNGKSLGSKHKQEGEYHVMWRMPFTPGTLKAVSKKAGKVVLEKKIHTAGAADGIELIADRPTIQANGTDLSFITVKIVDEEGVMAPNADNLVNFEIDGPAFIAGVDNGYQASVEAFKANYRKAFKGKCLLIIQSDGNAGEIKIKATSKGLQAQTITVNAQ